jgi:hypothetical protein
LVIGPVLSAERNSIKSQAARIIKISRCADLSRLSHAYFLSQPQQLAGFPIRQAFADHRIGWPGRCETLEANGGGSVACCCRLLRDER